MLSQGINVEKQLRGQLANPGSPGTMTVKTVCVKWYALLMKQHAIQKTGPQLSAFF